MKKNILIILVFLFQTAIAQEKKKTNYRFHAMGSIGVLAGQSMPKPFAQFSSGMVFKKYYAGIGFGYDAYRFISYPVFVEGRMQIGNKQQGFIFSGLGYNFPGKNEKNDEDPWANSSTYTGGAYLDLGLGFKPWRHISFSAGFSYKEMRNTSTYVYPCLVAPCPEDKSKTFYGLGRILAKMSVELGH